MEAELSEFSFFLLKEKVIKQPVHDDLIKKFINFRTAKMLGLPDIVSIVCFKTGIEIQRIKEKNRKREIVEARQIAMWMMNSYTRLSLSAIGAYFESEGHKFDHATVLHAIKTVNNLRETDKDFREKFESVHSEIELFKNSEINNG